MLLSTVALLKPKLSHGTVFQKLCSISCARKIKSTESQKGSKAVFAEALKATEAHRGTAEHIADVPSILHNIETSTELKAMWDKYRKQFAYAAEIEYDQIIAVLKTLTA